MAAQIRGQGRGVMMIALCTIALLVGGIGGQVSAQAGQFGQVGLGAPQHPVQPAPGGARRQGPDVFGGYASGHILIQVRDGFEPQLRPDGRWAIEPADAAGTLTAIESAHAVLLEAALLQWDVWEIRSAGSVEPANVELARELGLDRYYKVRVPEGTETPLMADDLAHFSAVIERAELDGIGGIAGEVIPNDTYFSLLWGLRNVGQVIQGVAGIPGADISATFAWDLHTGADDDWLILAIIDSGVNEHSDLEGRLVPGWNTNANNGNTNDNADHGTHVAGTAAANADNGVGIAGVHWGTKIMPVRVLNNWGGGTEAQCADGIIFAADNGAHVANLSLQYYTGTSYFENAVQYGHAAGMVIVAATGNNQGDTIAFPARWPETIAVGATDNRDRHASFSNYGPEISVVAPGVDVVSLFKNSQYAWGSGTSMASPHVAGLACLIRTYNSTLSNDEVRAVIESTADDLGSSGWNQTFGYGRVNAHAALLSIDPADPDPGPEPEPEPEPDPEPDPEPEPDPDPEPGDPVPAPLDGYEVELGTPVTSGLHLLEESDNQYLEIQSVHVQGRHRTNTIVDAASPAETVLSFDLTIETGSSHSQVTTIVEVWRHGQNGWSQIASFDQPTADTVSVFENVSGDDVVDPATGLISVRIRTEARQNQTPGGYTFRIDHVEVIVTPLEN